MKLLITTQKINKDDSTFGFFHDWVAEFAAQCEEVTVIALEVGPYDLPKNVRVLSLGKERGTTSRLQYAAKFYQYIWRERARYTHVFVHMNQIYVVLAGLLWRILGKKITLWYVHRQVTLSLRIATMLTHAVFTAAPESFNITTPKLHVVGHGIDVRKFTVSPIAHPTLSLVSVGRITRIKNLQTLIKAVEVLHTRNIEVECTIIGPAVTSDDAVYLEELERSVAHLPNIHFIGAVANKDLPVFFAGSNININLTPTGGIDKVVLEGILAGALPVVSNTAFTTLFGDLAPKLIFQHGSPESLADILTARIAERDVLPQYVQTLQQKVRTTYSLQSLITRVLTIMNTL